MRWKVACLLAAALPVGAGAGDDLKKEQGRFGGTWALSELKYDGEEHKLKFNIVFKGDEGKVEGNEKVSNEYAKIKFKLDPKATPRAIDITVSGGSQTDATMQGIYELKDDELRICVKVFGTGRPKEFAAPDGSSTVLLVLKREAK